MRFEDSYGRVIHLDEAKRAALAASLDYRHVGEARATPIASDGIALQASEANPG